MTLMIRVTRADGTKMVVNPLQIVSVTDGGTSETLIRTTAPAPNDTVAVQERFDVIAEALDAKRV